LVGKGLSLDILSQLMMWVSFTMVPMALPLAVLLAALMTFGNMGEHLELLAIKAAGVSLVRIMIPLLVATFILGIINFSFSNYVLPIANLRMRSLIYDIQKQRPELQIKEGVFYNGIENYSIKIGHKDNKTNMLYNLMVYDHSQNKGNVNVTVADSGTIKITDDKRFLVMTLFNGYNYNDLEGEKKKRTPTYPFRREQFSKQTINIALSDFGLQRTDENLFKSNYQMMNLRQLSQASDSISVIINKESSDFKNVLTVSTAFNPLIRPPVRLATDSAQKDTLNLAAFQLDSLMTRFSLSDQQMMVTNALNSARTAISNIEAQKMMRETRERRVFRHHIEWHRKFTLPVACIIFFFIGAPFGAIVRKGGLGLPVVISIVFFVFYYIISLTGEKFVREGILPASIGMWISAFILLPIGGYLTYKATHDSSLLNTEAYIIRYQKIKKRIDAFMKIQKGGPQE